MLHAAVRGFVLAFGLILPLGVQNTFVFSQGAAHRRWVRGLPVAVTAAACDTLLIAVGVSGVSLLASGTPWLWTALNWTGLAFLGYVGLATWRAEPHDGAPTYGDEWPAKRQVRFAMTVSLLNPHAILDTIGVIGTGSLSYGTTAEKIAYAVACATVSWIWFVGLLTAGHLAGSLAPSGPWRKALNRASALVMWGVALSVLLGLLAGSTGS